MIIFNIAVISLYFALCNCDHIRRHRESSSRGENYSTTVLSTTIEYYHNDGTVVVEDVQTNAATTFKPFLIHVSNNLNYQLENETKEDERPEVSKDKQRQPDDNIYLSYNTEQIPTYPQQKEKDENSLVQLYNNLGINNLLVPNTPTTFYRRKTNPEMNAAKSRETNVGLDINVYQLTGHMSMFEKFKTNVKAIFPGTNWCGGGNQAKSENDIGFFYLTDSCCRDHDRCFSTIPAGEELNNLKNNGLFTRSHCECDRVFLNCLKSANTFVSNQIGYTYFNILGPQCFRFEHPIIGCAKRVKKKCTTYVIDETKAKKWQWFDNQIY